MAPVLTNQQILFKSRPDGFPTENNFEHVKSEISQDLAGSQDVLVQLLDLSVDPYLRARMNAGKSYFPGFELGKVHKEHHGIPSPCVCCHDASELEASPLKTLFVVCSLWPALQLAKWLPPVTANSHRATLFLEHWTGQAIPVYLRARD